MSKKSSKSSRRSPAERVSFIISLSIVSTIFILICYTWISGDSEPPILAVKTFEIRQTNQQYYVPFTVSNSGGKTATAVEVVAQLSIAPADLQVGRQEVDFLSRQETHSGEFIFTQDPRLGQLTVRVASYQEP